MFSTLLRQLGTIPPRGAARKTILALFFIQFVFAEPNTCQLSHKTLANDGQLPAGRETSY